MANLIKGTHHVAIKCMNSAKFDESIRFYHDILGLEIVRSWGEGDGRGMMFSTGDGILEMFASGMISGQTGAVNHFALSTDDVSACIEAVRKEGYVITVEPKDICIPADHPMPACVGFCQGPNGESIEFFNEK